VSSVVEKLCTVFFKEVCPYFFNVFVSSLISDAVSHFLISVSVTLSGLVVSVLAIESKVHRFTPGLGQWIFKGNKNL
jgi:hypothetical protein